MQDKEMLEDLVNADKLKEAVVANREAPEYQPERVAKLLLLAAGDQAMMTQELNLTQFNAVVASNGYNGAYLFFGHGSKGQFKDTAEMERALDQVVAEFDNKHGKGKWLLVFGGDPANAEKPDIVILLFSERGYDRLFNWRDATN